ncbi:MAG: hypothetical protein SPI34_00445 [Opitutales bacterium]|nr:hypothetical protein [Opitutales bacterium]
MSKKTYSLPACRKTSTDWLFIFVYSLAAIMLVLQVFLVVFLDIF